MFGIDFGPSTGETGATNALTGESAFSGTQGEGLVSQDSALISAILSGNQAKIGQLLAPQISNVAKNANQKTQTNAEFGTRSGGTNASNQNTMDTARSTVNDLISNLTNGAMGAAGSLGSSLLGQSMKGYGAVFDQNLAMQNQQASKWNDLGSGIASLAEAGFGLIPTGGGSIPTLDTTGGSDPLGLNAPPPVNFGSYGAGSFPNIPSFTPTPVSPGF